MAHSGALNYYDLKKFCEMTTLGKLTPMHQVELPNVSGDQIYKIPYNSHLTHLCNKYDENALSLCSMLMNQINQDMISRLELSPIFREKVNGVIRENNFEDEVQCSQIFPIREEQFDYKGYLQEKNSFKTVLSEIENLNQLSDEDELYDNLTQLISQCDICDSQMNDKLSSLKKITQGYQPKYGGILLDLGTRHKPFYMEGFIKDPRNTRIVQRVNREVSQRIPDNIETIMMNVGLWLPQCISRESRKIQLDYNQMMNELSQKKGHLIDMKNRLPDPSNKSFAPTNFLQNLVQSIITMDDSSEDEGPEQNSPKNINIMEIEDKIKKALGNKVDDEADDDADDEADDDADDEADDDAKTNDKPLYELTLKDTPHFYSSGEDDESDEDDSDLN